MQLILLLYGQEGARRRLQIRISFLTYYIEIRYRIDGKNVKKKRKEIFRYYLVFD